MSHSNDGDSKLYLPSSVSRRSLIKGAGATALGVSMASVLAACGGSSDGDNSSGTSGGSETDSGGGGDDSNVNREVSMGSNRSNDVDRDALQKVVSDYEFGEDVTINTTDSEAFQESINSYLQGSPDPVFTWFAGFRMQFFAESDLLTPIDDVWEDIGGDYTPAIAAASTGLDGKKYFVPFVNSMWAVFYRPSVWEERGYEPPSTFDEWITLNEKIKADGLTPISFANSDGWPAFGTFDYLNLRINGTEFHRGLMAGEESWDSDEVREVFKHWDELLPFYQDNPLGRTWEEGAQAFGNGEAASHVLGLFVTTQIDELEDLDFFQFPEINPEHGQDALEAPIDGFLLSKGQEDNEGAKDLLRHLASATSQDLYHANNPGFLPLNNRSDRDALNVLNKKAAETINGAKDITQFLDRDARPDFVSTVALPQIQEYIREPASINSILKTMEAQKVEIYGKDN